MTPQWSKILRISNGSSIVEFAIVLPFILLITGGMMDAVYLGYQYNAAIKAVERGARLAAVSAPVAASFRAKTKAALDASASTGVSAGARISRSSAVWTPITCTSQSTSNVPPLSVSCDNGYTADADAFSRIYFGRKPSGTYECGGAFTSYSAGICDIFPDARPNNLTISYIPTGLDFYGNPEGAIPEILLTLAGVKYKSVFLSVLIQPFSDQLPDIRVSIVGEDLSTTYP